MTNRSNTVNIHKSYFGFWQLKLISHASPWSSLWTNLWARTNLNQCFTLLGVFGITQETPPFICSWLGIIDHNSWNQQKKRSLKFSNLPHPGILQKMKNRESNKFIDTILRWVFPKVASCRYSGSLGSGGYPERAKKTCA